MYRNVPMSGKWNHHSVPTENPLIGKTADNYLESTWNQFQALVPPLPSTGWSKIGGRSRRCSNHTTAPTNGKTDGLGPVSRNPPIAPPPPPSSASR